jgi:hypothetical protein
MEITMCCFVDEHQLRPIHEVTENAKSSTAIAHIERDLKAIDGTFEKMKSDITNNISEVDKQKRKFLSDISDIRKSLNDQAMNRAVEFVLISMFGASVLNR